MNFSLNPEDKLIISKAKDTIYLSEKRFSSAFYGFLNEHESTLIQNVIHLDDNCMFWGGYDNAKRVVFGSGVRSTDEFPISALCFRYKSDFELSHRDFLGSLMSLGIERSTLGDIIVNDGQAIVFVKNDIAPFIEQEVRKIGRVGVKITDYDLSDFTYEDEFDEISLTISSLRLDVFVSALCKISRDKACKLIESEMVTVNHQIQTSNSKPLCVCDVVTIRKYGKFVFAENNGFSKKGKFKVLVKHFR